MAKIMKVDSRQARPGQRRTPHPVAEVAIPYWRARRAGEHERVGKAGGKDQCQPADDRRARPRSLPDRKRNRTRTAPWPGGPNLNVPGGKLTGLVVTRPGEPKEKEKVS